MRLACLHVQRSPVCGDQDVTWDNQSKQSMFNAAFSVTELTIHTLKGGNLPEKIIAWQLMSSYCLSSCEFEKHQKIYLMG